MTTVLLLAALGSAMLWRSADRRNSSSSRRRHHPSSSSDSDDNAAAAPPMFTTLPNHRHLAGAYQYLPAAVRQQCWPDQLGSDQWWRDHGHYIDWAIAFLLLLMLLFALHRLREISCWAIKSNAILRRLDAIEAAIVVAAENHQPSAATAALKLAR